MPIPDFEAIMLPLLQIVQNGDAQKTREVVRAIGSHFSLTPDEMKEPVPSGTVSLINNRVSWAATYLRKAGLLKGDKRGYIQITDEGASVVKSTPPKVDKSYLGQFPSFIDFQARQKTKKSTNKSQATAVTDTPELKIGEQIQQINKALEDDLLGEIRANTPEFFEQLVVDLVVRMGYGGSQEDAGKAIGQSNDGGIDGTIKEDILGLDTIYLQAKRWKSTVPITAVRDFAGALLAVKSRKGIFITTSSFPESAEQYVRQIEQKIVLIDGSMLTNLMIEHEIGVSTKDVYKVKGIDSDYFDI